MYNLAIIPARGGSKRIPGKNIKSFLGKPIIAYSIETALGSGLFNNVMVSTDDTKIATVAKKYGADVPFMRSHENANDYATTSDVICEVLNEYSNQGYEVDFACCLYPTAPLIRTEQLENAFKLLTSKHFDSVISVFPFSYPVQRALHFRNEKIEMINPEFMNSRSQDLEKTYHDAGQFYFLDVKKFLIHKRLFSNNSGAIFISELQAQDIDNESDWLIAELKYKALHKM